MLGAGIEDISNYAESGFNIARQEKHSHWSMLNTLRKVI
jgi:hypothetical protein